MIRVDDIQLTIADQQANPRFAFDLGEILFAPQVLAPDPQGLLPPARPPFKLDFAPGTLWWPTGASRYAVGQYVVTCEEANAIRALVDGDILANPVTLTLGGEGTGEDELEFQMHVLHPGLPLQFSYAPLRVVYPPDLDCCIYLLVLVDHRYFLQTRRATWEITDADSWEDIDDLVGAFMGDATMSPTQITSGPELQPGLLMQHPALPGAQVAPSLPGLLDAYALASGRRWVSLRDGTYHLQGPLEAAEHALAMSTNFARRRYGGELAFTAQTAELPLELPGPTARFAFLAPAEFVVVFPGTDGTDETAPYEVTISYATARGDPSRSLWPTNAQPLLEGTLYVHTTGWNDGNDSACDSYAQAWCANWLDWLAQPEITVYSGVAPFEPSASVDWITWVTQKGDVCTIVSRGMLNPRPALVHIYSGVGAPTGGGGSGTLDIKGGTGPLASTATSVLDLDPTYITATESPAGEVNLLLVEASGTTGGVLTDSAQQIVGQKAIVAAHPQLTLLDDAGSVGLYLGYEDTPGAGIDLTQGVGSVTWAAGVLTIATDDDAGGDGLILTMRADTNWTYLVNDDTDAILVLVNDQGLLVDGANSFAFLPSGGGPVLACGAGTDPTGIDSASAGVYAKVVTGTTELRTFDGAGNLNTITPHAMDGPDWLYDEDDPLPQVSREENVYVGIIRWTNHSRKARLLERLLAGEDLSKLPEHKRRFVHVARRPRRSWDDDQQELVKRRQEEIDRQRGAVRAKVLAPYVPKPCPDWLVDLIRRAEALECE